jgi:uncharacterized membrane protein YgdD (TMEM256/DUF423 family)
MQRIWVAIGAAFGLTTVAMAAYQAHGLADASAAAREGVANAVLMQGLHALVLLFLGLWAERGGWAARLAGIAITFGVIAFCGTVYSGAIPAIAALHHGPLAPIGGTTLMLGWLLLLISAVRA